MADQAGSVDRFIATHRREPDVFALARAAPVARPLAGSPPMAVGPGAARIVPGPVNPYSRPRIG
jgi:hypothetical protein